MCMLFDNNKQLLGSSDVFPAKFNVKHKGEYLIRVQIRHENYELLNQLKGMSLLLDFKLKSSLTLATFDTWEAALVAKP